MGEWQVVCMCVYSESGGGCGAGTCRQDQKAYDLIIGGVYSTFSGFTVIQPFSLFI